MGISTEKMHFFVQLPCRKNICSSAPCQRSGLMTIRGNFDVLEGRWKESLSKSPVYLNSSYVYRNQLRSFWMCVQIFINSCLISVSCPKKKDFCWEICLLYKVYSRNHFFYLKVHFIWLLVFTASLYSVRFLHWESVCGRKQNKLV